MVLSGQNKGWNKLETAESGVSPRVSEQECVYLQPTLSLPRLRCFYVMNL